MTIREAMSELKWLGICTNGDSKRVEIIAVALAKVPTVFSMLFKKDVPEMRNERDAMIDYIGCLSGGEQVLARFAIDVWFYGDDKKSANIGDICRRLDDQNLENVMTAMTLWRHL